MRRIALAYFTVAFVIWAFADGVLPGRLVGRGIFTWDPVAIAAQTLPAISVQPSGGDELARVFTDLVGDNVARTLRRNRLRIGAGLVAVAVLGVALIAGFVIGMKKREARAVAALDRDRSRGQKLRDLDRRRMRDQQP